MPNPVDTLRREHHVVRQALAALTGIGLHLQRGGEFPHADATMLLRFLREFFLAVHMRKETDSIIPAVAMHADEAMAEVSGALAVAQDEASELLHTLVLIWEPQDRLEADERQVFADSAIAFQHRIEQLMRLEEQRIFPLAERCVPADDRLHWCDTFDAIDRGHEALAVWARRVAILRTRWAA